VSLNFRTYTFDISGDDYDCFDAHAEHMAAMAGHAEHGDGKMMDCCKHCCDDMAKDGHGDGDSSKH